MILRIVHFVLAAIALCAVLYFYDNLTIFRRTVFWEFRYLIFTLGTFLGLSALQSALDRVPKTQGLSKIQK